MSVKKHAGLYLKYYKIRFHPTLTKIKITF